MFGGKQTPRVPPARHNLLGDLWRSFCGFYIKATKREIKRHILVLLTIFSLSQLYMNVVAPFRQIFVGGL